MRSLILDWISQAPFQIKRTIIILMDFVSIMLVWDLSALNGLTTLTFQSAIATSIFMQVGLAGIGIYSVIPRFFGFFEVRSVMIVVLVACTIVLAAGKFAGALYIIPVFFLLCTLLIVQRSFYANWRRFLLRDNRIFEKVLIYGAGEAGLQLIRSIRASQVTNYFPVGFIDDHPGKLGLRLDGAPVLGGKNKLYEIGRKLDVKTVLVAMPSVEVEVMKEIYRLCNSAGFRVKTIPSLSELGDRDVMDSIIRDLDPADFLGRGVVQLDQLGSEEFFADQRVLVTGAGGSIGSELVLQIAALRPKSLILLDQSEIALYQLEQRILEQSVSTEHHFVLCDVRDFEQLETVFDNHVPNIVFHAAACKHVPIVENNKLHAIKTNVAGSMNTAKLSIAYGARNLVLVSTDKAVNPTNVMGATKRVAELACQYITAESDTTFCAVRFGNVLGSSGSVIPLFKKQMERGGPVTVTHPEVTRYFMSIPEACQLILQASLIADGGEIFVLDMGKPVRIVDLATALITSAGLIPNQDIEIIYTGLRPGEKLYEELLIDPEQAERTAHSNRVYQGYPV